jgi:hypothetical protein
MSVRTGGELAFDASHDRVTSLVVIPASWHMAVACATFVNRHAQNTAGVFK